MPTVEGLEDVIRVVKEASTSMHDQTGLAAGLDAGSLTLTHITPIQSEVMPALKVCHIDLAFIRQLNSNPLSVSQVRTTSELPYFGQMSWDDLFNLDLYLSPSLILSQK